MRTGLKLRRKEVTIDGGKVFVDGAHVVSCSLFLVHVV
jgi:hypothetical protein